MVNAGGVLRDAWETSSGTRLPEGPRGLVDTSRRDGDLLEWAAETRNEVEALRLKLAKHLLPD
jgi:hypothetical protein